MISSSLLLAIKFALKCTLDLPLNCMTWTCIYIQFHIEARLNPNLYSISLVVFEKLSQSYSHGSALIGYLSQFHADENSKLGGDMIKRQSKTIVKFILLVNFEAKMYSSFYRLIKRRFMKKPRIFIWSKNIGIDRISI